MSFSHTLKEDDDLTPDAPYVFGDVRIFTKKNTRSYVITVRATLSRVFSRYAYTKK